MGWAAGTDCRIERHGAVPSTNTIALDRARGGDRQGLWVVAEEQTAGRGRHGRAWHSPRGNLHATRLVVAPPPLSRMTGLAFVAAVALYDALIEVLPAEARRALAIKWPNDLVSNGAKLAGILVEADEIGPVCAGAVGIGVNLAEVPATPDATSLSRLGASVTTEEMLEHLGATLERWLGVWAEGRGFDAVRDAWLIRAQPLGTSVRVRTGRETIAGHFAGLDRDGALLLGLDGGGLRRIAAGEVLMAGEVG